MNFIVSKREFEKVLKAPFEKVFSIQNIISGFAKAEIHPLNPNVIDKDKRTPSTPHISSESDQSSSTSAPSTCTGTFLIVHPPDSSPYSSFHLSPSGNLSGSEPHPQSPAPNPLVDAGLIPALLPDVFSTPPGEQALQKRAHRITGARVLTNDENMAMLAKRKRS